MSVYLDYNATAPMRPEVKARVIEVMDVLGNPASIHAAGRSARKSLSTLPSSHGKISASRPSASLRRCCVTIARSCRIAGRSATWRACGFRSAPCLQRRPVRGIGGL